MIVQSYCAAYSLYNHIMLSDGTCHLQGFQGKVYSTLHNILTKPTEVTSNISFCIQLFMRNNILLNNNTIHYRKRFANFLKQRRKQNLFSTISQISTFQLIHVHQTSSQRYKQSQQGGGRSLRSRVKGSAEVEVEAASGEVFLPVKTPLILSIHEAFSCAVEEIHRCSDGSRRP